MDNRYLFKAKRMDNGEWVIGNLVFSVYHKNDVCVGQYGNDIGMHTVDPSTICQCTGLKDDNNTLIFENDVLSLSEKVNDYEWEAFVRFGNPNAEYTWGWQLVPATECDANKDILLWVNTDIEYTHCEVIGNIFGNKELLVDTEE